MIRTDLNQLAHGVGVAPTGFQAGEGGDSGDHFGHDGRSDAVDGLLGNVVNEERGVGRGRGNILKIAHHAVVVNGVKVGGHGDDSLGLEHGCVPGQLERFGRIVRADMEQDGHAAADGIHRAFVEFHSFIQGEEHPFTGGATDKQPLDPFGDEEINQGGIAAAFTVYPSSSNGVAIAGETPKERFIFNCASCSLNMLPLVFGNEGIVAGSRATGKRNRQRNLSLDSSYNGRFQKRAAQKRETTRVVASITYFFFYTYPCNREMGLPCLMTPDARMSKKQRHSGYGI